MKRLLAIFFVAFLLPIAAWAQCTPAAAPAGSIGCFPQEPSAALSDFLYGWRPSLWPNPDITLTVGVILNTPGSGQYAPIANPTFTGTVTMPGGGTWSVAGITATAGTFNTLSLTGALTLTATGTALTVNNNALIGGSLTVNGAEIIGGMFSQTTSVNWAPGFPGGNLGIFQGYSGDTGTPTAGWGGPEGTSVPKNLIVWNESLVSAPYPLTALEIQHNYCQNSVSGTTCNGGRNTLLVEAQLLGVVGTSNNFYVTEQIFNKDSGNVTGATSGNPLGDFFGFAVNQQISSGSYAYEAAGEEFDYTEASGAVVKYHEFAKYVDGSTVGAITDDAFLRFESNNQVMKYGLTFGDPQNQNPGNGAPVSSTGTLIYAYGGTYGIGIDLSHSTFNTAFLKGPGGFTVDGSGDLTVGGTATLDGNISMLGLGTWSNSGGKLALNTTPQFGGLILLNELQLNGSSNNTIYTSGSDHKINFQTTDGIPVNINSDGTGSVANYIYISGTGTASNYAKVSSENASGTYSNLHIDCAGNGPPICETLFDISTTGASPLILTAAASTVANGMEIISEPSGTGPILEAQGTDTSVSLNLSSQGATSSVGLWSAAGTYQTFQAAGVSGSNGWIAVLPGIAASQMMQVYANGTGNNILLGGPLGGGALSTSATSGFPAMPVTNGTPSGTPVNSGNGAVFETDVTNTDLNIYIPTKGWYHAALTSGAG